jgi:hypothetical protein
MRDKAADGRPGGAPVLHNDALLLKDAMDNLS